MTLADRLRAQLAASADRPVPYANDMRGPVGGIATPAAVLIAITDRKRPGLILTQRPDTMRRHPGQVAFPGGRIDAGDADPVAAALREAEEEIALPPHLADIVGTLDRYRTVTGFEIVPVLAVIPPDLPLIPHDAEVAAVFEPPLDLLLDASNWREQSVMVGGRERRYLEQRWSERRIWGATAAMLANLAARIGT